MINETRERLTLEENVKLIKDIFFGKQTSQLRLIDLKSIEVSNRDGNEDEDKNDELAEIFENLLDYCKSGITIYDLINLYNVDTRKHSEEFAGHRYSNVSAGGKKLIDIINSIRGVPTRISSSSYEKWVNALVKKENQNSLESDTCLGRITSLMMIAFYANKAEKRRIDEYFGRNKRSNVDKLGEEDLQIIDSYKKILYDIKQECVRQAIVTLTTDKEAIYNGSWGIDWDEERKAYLFTYLDDEQVIPFSFHIPAKCCRTFSKEIMSKIARGEYSIDRIKNEKTRQALKKLCKKQILEEPTLALKKSDRRIVESTLEVNRNTKTKEFSEVELILHKVLGNLAYEQDEEEINSEMQTQPQEAEEVHKKIINDIKRSNGIVVTQYGENLDLHSIIATLQYYFDKNESELGIKIKREMIDTGKESNKHLTIDAGNLTGNKNINSNKSAEINANQRKGQRSAVSILAENGFYVPRMIVKYADAVISDERVLDPFNGCALAREVPTDKLFEYAEEKDVKTKKYLMESSLDEEQLKRYGLYDFAMKRKNDIENAIKLISQNSYCIGQNGTKKKIAVVPQFVYNGSNIAYALGYDVYISITPYKRDSSKSTFSITLNPNAKNEKGQNLLIPENIISILNEKISVYNQDEITGNKQKKEIFVLPNKKLASVGGPKFPGLYADKTASEIREIFTSKLLRDEEQAQLVEKKLMEIRAKHKGITGREIFEASKSAIKNPELLDQAQKVICGDIEHQSEKSEE